MGRNSRNTTTPKANHYELGQRRSRRPWNLCKRRPHIRQRLPEHRHHRHSCSKGSTIQQEHVRHHGGRNSSRPPHCTTIRRYRTRSRSRRQNHGNLHTHDSRPQVVRTSRQFPHHSLVAHTRLHNTRQSAHHQTTIHSNSIHRSSATAAKTQKSHSSTSTFGIPFGGVCTETMISNTNKYMARTKTVGRMLIDALQIMK